MKEINYTVINHNANVSFGTEKKQLIMIFCLLEDDYTCTLQGNFNGKCP